MPNIQIRPFNLLLGGQNIPAFELSDERIRARFSAFGARMLALHVRNRDASETNIAVGLATLDDYLAQDSYIGAICGRYANRIKNACYRQDGKTVTLLANEGPNQLHGGPDGFDRRIWQSSIGANGTSVTFSLTSPDGDQGYPGELNTDVTYRIAAPGALRCEITARCTKPTIINMTSHAYWNLTGDFTRSAAGHDLQITADHYLPVDGELIPRPGHADVADTIFDFRKPRRVDEMINGTPTGYDHNFCLAPAPRGTLRKIAILRDPQSGRRMELSSSEPGLQFYLSQHFTDAMKTPDAQPLHRAAGIALEPQTFPDSPNRPDFPSAILQPGETYRHVIEWEFS
ncbi:MAG: aldose epimerase family protein [Pseudomonadota bacterium]